jgi:hypothetical protein
MGYCRIISFIVFLFTIFQFSCFTDVQGGECKLLTLYLYIQGIFVSYIFNSGGTQTTARQWEAVIIYEYANQLEIHSKLHLNNNIWAYALVTFFVSLPFLERDSFLRVIYW